MKPNLRILFPFAILLALGGFAAVADSPLPLIQAHAHNDYQHTRPLLDALAHGFCSVEADIHLVNGQLLVAHDRSQAKPGRTLQSLYLDPLRARVKQNGGRVYPNGPEFTLLIDLKTDWRTIYPVLRSVLTNYSDLLSTFRNDAKHTNAVTAVISGSRTNTLFAGEATRYATLDGLVADLDLNPPATLVPWISASWGSLFRWRGQGEFSAAEAEKLRDIVSRAHGQGRRVRFWGAPDHVEFWRTLRSFDVDLINTDDLAGLEILLRETKTR